MSLSFYRTRSFWTVVTVAGHWFLSWARKIQFTSSNTIFICLLFSHIRLREVLKWPFLSGFRKEIQHELVIRENVVDSCQCWKILSSPKRPRRLWRPLRPRLRRREWSWPLDLHPATRFLHYTSVPSWCAEGHYFTVLYCTVTKCIVLYCTVLYCNVL